MSLIILAWSILAAIRTGIRHNIKDPEFAGVQRFPTQFSLVNCKTLEIEWKIGRAHV